MENLKIILFDETEIRIDMFGIPTHIVVSGTREDLLEIWSEMTPDNLSVVNVKSGDSTIAILRDARLDGVQFAQDPGFETMTAHFYLTASLMVGEQIPEGVNLEE